MTTANNVYDEVPYEGQPFAQTHPDRLATLGKLFRMTPAPVESCRVLELGCGEGANLIPMALVLPASEFVGIDSAASAIAKGQATVNALGLGNITLRNLDILDISGDLGKFDYIIAHGVYSWVPEPVREKLIRIARENLAPQGIAYISYNTYPGAHMRDMIREMMLFHAGQFPDPSDKVDQSRALLHFLADVQPPESAYGAVLRHGYESVAKRSGYALFHDELAEANAPVYFHQFVGNAMRNGLQYLAEAEFASMQDFSLPPEVAETLGHLSAGDAIQKEQYLDFIKGRRFRQTLLCHEGIALDRELNADRLKGFYFASSVAAVSGKPDLESHSEEEFRTRKGTSVKVPHPVAKVILAELGRAWPAWIHFDELLERVRAHRSEAHAGLLGEILLAGYGSGIVEVHTLKPPFTCKVSERPVASPLVRMQAQTGSLVMNLAHDSVNIGDALSRRLLTLLDGTRDREGILAELIRTVLAGEAPLVKDDVPVTDEEKVAGVLQEDLDSNLAGLANCALFVA